MATLKRLTRDRRSESLRGSFMVDTVRGVLRVRKWPRKRGTPKSAKQRWWNDWFKQANYLAKYVDGATAARAIEITAGSGMYPRDIILSAMRGRLYRWVDQNGKVWNSMAAVTDISESLDVLAQNIGDILVRATDRWRAPPAGVVGDVLTHQGAGASPVWLGAAAAGLVSQELAESPIVADNSVSAYYLNVTNYAAVEITFDAINLASSGTIYARYSIDDGVSYEDGGTDYRVVMLKAGADENAGISAIDLQYGATSADMWGSIRFENLRAGRAVSRGFIGPASQARQVGSFANFDGPVTHIKLTGGGGINFASGTIRAVGFVAA